VTYSRGDSIRSRVKCREIREISTSVLELSGRRIVPGDRIAVVARDSRVRQVVTDRDGGDSSDRRGLVVARQTVPPDSVIAACGGQTG